MFTGGSESHAAVTAAHGTVAHTRWGAGVQAPLQRRGGRRRPPERHSALHTGSQQPMVVSKSSEAVYSGAQTLGKRG